MEFPCARRQAVPCLVGVSEMQSDGDGENVSRVGRGGMSSRTCITLLVWNARNSIWHGSGCDMSSYELQSDLRMARF